MNKTIDAKPFETVGVFWDEIFSEAGKRLILR